MFWEYIRSVDGIPVDHRGEEGSFYSIPARPGRYVHLPYIKTSYGTNWEGKQIGFYDNGVLHLTRDAGTTCFHLAKNAMRSWCEKENVEDAIQVLELTFEMWDNLPSAAGAAPSTDSNV